MIQTIITYIILAVVFGYVIFKFAKFFIGLAKGKTDSACTSCSKGSCEGCPFAGGGMNFAQYNSMKIKELKK